ncbi:MAG: type II toxin-antitoxin system RelE/ParE family toxin [Bacteroidia bacterium]|nr:type II toxin-antitoxin system RelE/ParE family toxin [Bacteroidia bacterium]
MSYNIYTTNSFERELKSLAKKYHSIKNDVKNFSLSLKENPMQGEPLGKDCYKIRMAITSKGKGKSGGARIITCVKIIRNSVYLISLYDKSEKESISDNELDNLLKAADLL